MSIRGEEIALFQDEATAHERSLTLLTNAVRKLEMTLAHLGSETEPRMQSVNGKSLAVQRAQIDELQRALAEKNDAVEGLKQGMKRIKHSFSWKLTSPLRKIRRIGARIGRYVSGP